MSGPYVYARVDDLENTDKVGSRQCVALIQHYAAAPATALWKQGSAVRGNMLLTKGTAIATFVDGRYQSHAHHNHAAFYMSQDATGIVVMDQWLSDKSKPKVSHRHIPFKGKNKNGAFNDPSNNADAFSVIN